jgi:hypothetical protein
MVSGLEKAMCVLSFHGTECVVTLQRQFRQKYEKIPSREPSVFLDARIGEAFAKVDREVLRNAWQEFEYLILL